MRRLACLLTLLLLAGCSRQAFYDSLQEDSARRQYEPGREIARDPPPSFDAYDKERRRIQEQARP